ncbi:glycolate oxidase subunit GlcE [Puniceibacterium sediminis]|uniref:Glycolate oxidase FAD binding subunit n=1 Tax=Puniceibacterium sediminis TaxID=1608407 RepID=A0A238VVI2_9RHOB|nr:glycolate oxidase subunit GlcE [Puniceibacterium sediminis]SNR38310.1 glycolate oxidase FAD binding subunit [Puniceibacterium sediminis]
MRPETEAELAEMIAAAKGPLHVQGGGTRPVGQPVTGEMLHTSGMSGITLYEPGALTLVVQAGTPLAEIEAALDAEGQRLPFEPMDHRGLLGTSGTPTIGGVVASNASGPRRIQVGACRDFMLGVRFVDGQGTVIKNGGRVMKNVTGYDLVKLLSGSWGTLGVLSEVSLKVLPKPDSAATLKFRGLDVAQAVSVMSRALGSPFEITGAAHDPQAGQTLLRIEGFAQSVTYRAGQLRALFSDHAIEIENDPAQVAATWAGIRDVAPLQDGTGDVWRLSVKPSDAPELVARLDAEALLFDWGGGLIWARVPEGTDLRARMSGVKGHATLIRGSAASRAALPVFHPEPAPLAHITDGLRLRFDPRGILNPGLMGA